MFDVFGVHLFSEHHLVTGQEGLRHDHPIGFDAFFRVRVSSDLQVRPFLGACAVFSFIEPEQRDVQGPEDVLFGAHVGVGIDWSVADLLVLFAELRGTAYVGHGTTTSGWTSDLEERLSFEGVAQLSLGAAIHFDL